MDERSEGTRAAGWACFEALDAAFCAIGDAMVTEWRIRRECPRNVGADTFFKSEEANPTKQKCELLQSRLN